jgi:hypothetical protein
VTDAGHADEQPAITLAEVIASIQRAKDNDELAASADLARGLADGDKAVARVEYDKRHKALAA